jgi:hypothetical protein
MTRSLDGELQVIFRPHPGTSDEDLAPLVEVQGLLGAR